MTELTSLGLGKTMKRKLQSVGIHSAEELIAIGTLQAVSKLKTKYPNTCIVIAYHLEAAINRTNIKQLDAKIKQELKAQFEQL